MFYDLGVKECKEAGHPMRWGLTDERLQALAVSSFENMSSGNKVMDLRLALEELIEFRKGKDK